MPNSVSDMEFDEVSFVEKGANQEAKIVLWKSEDRPVPMEVDKLAQELREQERSKSDLIPAPELDAVMTYAEAVAKVYERQPELYERELYGEELAKADPWDAERRDTFVDVERLADQLQVAHRFLTRAEAVAKALQMRPEIYDKAVLMSAEGPMQRETAG
jgi:hypothetical protein